MTITAEQDVDMYRLAGRETLRAEARVTWQREDGGYTVDVTVRQGDTEPPLWGRRCPRTGQSGADYAEQALAAAGNMLVDAGYMSLRAGDAWTLAEAAAEWQCGTYTISVVDFWYNPPVARKFGDLATGDQESWAQSTRWPRTLPA